MISKRVVKRVNKGASLQSLKEGALIGLRIQVAFIKETVVLGMGYKLWLLYKEIKDVGTDGIYKGLSLMYDMTKDGR